MARLPRLSVAGYAHLVLLRGHNGESVFRDGDDRSAFLSALDAALKIDQVALHGFALQADCVWLLCTPRHDGHLSRAMQSLGRRFAAAFNRRHDRSGTVWDGRFRSTLVEPGATLLQAMVFVDQPTADALPADSAAAAADFPLWSSARHHLGLEASSSLSDTAEYWALGNTPFERAAAYRSLLSEPLDHAVRTRILSAVIRAWPLGSSNFIQQVRERIGRPLEQRPRGRPPKAY